MTLALVAIVAHTVFLTWSYSLNPDTRQSPATLQEAVRSRKTIEELNHDHELALKLLVPVRILCALLYAGSASDGAYLLTARSLWSLKLCLLTFYSRFVNHLRWGKAGTTILWWTIILTFIGVIIATLTECRPLYLAWMIVPEDQGHLCSKGLVNLLVMAVSNAVTDIALIILPFPVLLQAKLDLKHKLQLSLLFGIGIIVVAITIIRVPLILIASVTQGARSMWASIENVCACIVANAAFFYALIKDFQSPSNSHHSSNNISSNRFYMQSLQSSAVSPGKRKNSAAPAEEEIDIEDSRPPSGNGSANSLWHGHTLN
ncbi:hypothetical protein FNYG_15008 [Fusarium nygamai]|uniref:Rhodopsin domain-containing protein n=1 Tax=Gibberella nygamai TaxID=42673 RepID=A0A2K0ULY9_GIBNY|nr:hypothetical protein FNYG_15008 [Fusarium nygamai]